VGGLTDSPQLVLASVLRRLPAGAVFSGRTAAWLHGLDFEPCNPIEATIPRASGLANLAGVSVRRNELPDADRVRRRGVPATTAIRTVFDLTSRPPLTEAVIAIDMALHHGLVRLPELRAWAGSHTRTKGIRQFRRVVELAEPKTESPMETRLRMLLVLARLPRPQVQVSLHDDHGRFLGRVDLFYPAQRLAIEYDGGTHRNSLVEDNRRQNLLVSAGHRLLRFTVADIRETPAGVVDQVLAALPVKPRQGAAPRQRAK
jgi:very-short-patch-repair endonuclease